MANFSNFLTTLGLSATLAFSSIVGLPQTKKVSAQQTSNRPYVVFVNGWEDCCTWGRYTDGSLNPLMKLVVDSLPPNSDIRYVPWDRFENGANQRSSTSNDAEFLRQAADFINQLDPNRPLILIGHSFGGDSLLSLAPRITRRIQFFGVIDPTAAGGLREPVTRRRVPTNVDYFFNRWQRNGLDNVDIFGARERLGIGGGSARNVVPFDSRVVNGYISDCLARSCDDQSEQSLARRQDGSEIRVSCEAQEVRCEGWRLPGCNLGGCWSGSNGTKAKRLAHNDMPLDEYLQRQMADRIGSVLANFRPPNTASNPVSSRLVNAATALCLDAKDYGRNGAGTPIQLWHCNDEAAQKWSRQSNGSLLNAATGLCLDAKDYGRNGAGTPIQLWHCNGEAAQEWR